MKLGTGGPALSAIVTGLGCGQDVPALGPADTMRVTWPPRATRDPFAGMVLTTRPLATLLSSIVLVAPGVRPTLRRSDWAVAVATPVTFGTTVYRPSNSHQPNRANTTTTASAAAR